MCDKIQLSLNGAQAAMWFGSQHENVNCYLDALNNFKEMHEENIFCANLVM